MIKFLAPSWPLVYNWIEIEMKLAKVTHYLFQGKYKIGKGKKR